MKPIRPAAAVVPVRPDGQVLAGIRSAAARSLKGYFAFPGGGSEDEDTHLPLFSAPQDEQIERACALRELGEETGRWLLCDPQGDVPSAAAESTFRQAVETSAPLLDALSQSGLVLDDRLLMPLGKWRTRSFRLRQFLLPLGTQPLVETQAGPELIDIQWQSIPEIWQGWHRGDVLLIPPIRFVIETLSSLTAHAPSWTQWASRLADVPDESVVPLVEVVAGIAVQPLRSQTLPPATTTNAVLLGAGDFYIVDPATPFADEQKRFGEVLERLQARGRKPRGIVLTHHHGDHVADVQRLRTELGLPVLAHPETASRVSFAVDSLLQEGDVLTCGGEPERTFRILHTPGHAAGHICLFEERTGVLVAGDMVAAEGSILIDPDDGHMGTYLQSLERLLALPMRRIIAAHGPLIADGAEKIQEQLAHRRMRAEQVWQALPADGEVTRIEELVKLVYGDTVAAEMIPFALRSLQSILTHLMEQNCVRQQDGGYMRDLTSSALSSAS